MAWPSAKDAVQRLWGRRWVRRVSYAVVAGAAIYTAVPWLVTRPGVLRWTLRKLDALVQEETGLPLLIGKVEFHPIQGRLVLWDVHWGGDLLTIQRVEVDVDPWSLVGSTHHIRAVRIEQPRVRLTEAGLAAIHFKERPPRTGPLPQVLLDQLSLNGGEVLVPQTFRGIPELRSEFSLKATGKAPNQLHFDLSASHISAKGPGGWESGRLDMSGQATEEAVSLRDGSFRFGQSQFRLKGRYQAAKKPGSEVLEAEVGGVLDLAQASRWGGLAQPPLAGPLDLTARLQGSLANPSWTFTAGGADLRPGQAAFVPGRLDLKASGGRDQTHLEWLRWASPQGQLEASGRWARRAPVQVTLQGTGLDLGALGRALRVEELKGVRGTLAANLQGPGTPDELARPDRWRGSLKLSLGQAGSEGGEVVASLDRGRLTLDQLRLDLEALKVEGTGWAALGPRGLLRMEAEGHAEVGAEQVAQALSAWKVVDLDMEGQASAQAKVSWSREVGLQLDGSVQVDRPRWHGARVDRLVAPVVEIRGQDLSVHDIDLWKGPGRGGGDLWLTWGKTAPGQPQMDMCYTASRLPVSEGLRAADLKDSQGRDLPITGTGSGWVRLWGPYQHLHMSGTAQAEEGEVYGIKVPAVYSDFWMDLEALRLKLTDLRVAERPDLLGRGELPPEGALALSGQADMDFRGWTWWVDLRGRLDSQSLALPGPRLQAQVEARLLGPITSPFAGLELPQGRLSLTRGRFFFGDKSLEGLTGSASLEHGRLAGRLGVEGTQLPLVDLEVHPEGHDLAGGLRLNISTESARTNLLARSLTEDLLEDLSLSATLQGRWKQGRDLAWTGTLDQLAANFSAFELHQSGPSRLRGTAQGAALDIALKGGARTAVPGSQAALMRLSGTIPFTSTAPLALRAQGDADLAHMKSILDRIMEVDEYSLLSELQVQGTSHFDLLAHGTLADPLLDGTLSLERGQMHLRGYQGMEDLQAQVVLKDRTITLPEATPLQGTLAHGALRASGTANWRLGGLDAYAFKASLANFQLRDVPDGLDLQGSLQATLVGTETGGLLKGRLTADRLSYQTEVKLADLILRSALSDSGGLTGLDLDDPLERIRLDLDLGLRTPWSFDTNLLKLEGRTEGPFQVLGTLAHPVPKGTMLFQPGGRITNIFPAGDMVVDRGSLTFSESRPLDPMISLQGSVTSIPGYTVNLDIRGTLSNLSIIPSSTPTLRQDEIVAILINPGNASSVGTAGASSGATQGAITQGLASASSGLISTLAFAPFQEQLRRTLGLDRVNVAVRSTTLGNTETEVTLGKSLNLLGQRSAFVVSHKKSGELSITSGQVEWRFGDLILQLGASKGGGTSLLPSGEIRHTWSPN